MYEFLKALFNDESGNPTSLTFDQLTERLSAATDIKLANIADGGYVSKEKHTAKITELNGVRQQLDEANREIQSYKDMDIDGIKQKASEWENKYKTDTAALNEKLAQQERAFARDLFFKSYQFSSQFAEDGVKAAFDKQDFKLVDGEFMGAKDYMNKLMTDDATKSAFVFEPADGGNEGGDPQPPYQPQFSQQQRQPQNPPKPQKSLLDLMKEANEHPERADSITFD